MPTVYLKLDVDVFDLRQSLEPGTPVTLNELTESAGSDLDATIVASVPSLRPPTYLAHFVSREGKLTFSSLVASTYEEAQSELEGIVKEDNRAGQVYWAVTLYEITRSSLLNVKAVLEEVQAVGGGAASRFGVGVTK